MKELELIIASNRSKNMSNVSNKEIVLSIIIER